MDSALSESNVHNQRDPQEPSAYIERCGEKEKLSITPPTGNPKQPQIHLEALTVI